MSNLSPNGQAGSSKLSRNFRKESSNVLSKSFQHKTAISQQKSVKFEEDAKSDGESDPAKEKIVIQD